MSALCINLLHVFILVYFTTDVPVTFICVCSFNKTWNQQIIHMVKQYM